MDMNQAKRVHASGKATGRFAIARPTARVQASGTSAKKATAPAKLAVKAAKKSK